MNKKNIYPLKDVIIRAIKENGPMPIDKFMELALAHPRFGYYHTRDPLGRSGDFITSPEISQIFGELIGIWCVMVWRIMGSPRPFVLAELGPGRGTLMSDLLRAGSVSRDFIEAARLCLVETSPVLRSAQQQTIGRDRALWVENLSEIPKGPLILVANEFFDALPVRQLQFVHDQWLERCVAYDGEELVFCTLGVHSPPYHTFPKMEDSSPLNGDIMELHEVGGAIASLLGKRLEEHGGIALILDYGHPISGYGDTLQAVKSHRKVQVLDSPGDADLTVHVDFQALTSAAAPASSGPVITQRDFLISLGIEERAKRLASCNLGRVEEIHAACHRLVASEAMGTMFKVVTLRQSGLASLPGFDYVLAP